jgi:hypothetical protein
MHKQAAEEVTAEQDENYGSLKEIIDDHLRSIYERGYSTRSPSESESIASLAQLPEFSKRPYLQK